MNTFFTDELKLRNISLKFSKVKLSDEGTYRCFIQDLSTESNVQHLVGKLTLLYIHCDSSMCLVRAKHKEEIIIYHKNVDT